MSAAIYPTEAIYTGDTWPGIPEITIRPNDEIPESAATAAEVIFFKAEDGPENPALTLGSPSKVTVSSGANWLFGVPPQILTLAPGEWTFRFRTTDAAGAIRTWITGTQLIL